MNKANYAKFMEKFSFRGEVVPPKTHIVIRVQIMNPGKEDVKPGWVLASLLGQVKAEMGADMVIQNGSDEFSVFIPKKADTFARDADRLVSVATGIVAGLVMIARIAENKDGESYEAPIIHTRLFSFPTYEFVEDYQSWRNDIKSTTDTALTVSGAV